MGGEACGEISTNSVPRNHLPRGTGWISINANGPYGARYSLETGFDACAEISTKPVPRNHVPRGTGWDSIHANGFYGARYSLEMGFDACAEISTNPVAQNHWESINAHGSVGDRYSLEMGGDAPEISTAPDAPAMKGRHWRQSVSSPTPLWRKTSMCFVSF